MSSCMTACSLSLLSASPSKAFFAPRSSFNSNSLSLLLFSSSLHTHLFACHFPFTSITPFLLPLALLPLSNTFSIRIPLFRHPSFSSSYFSFNSTCFCLPFLIYLLHWHFISVMCFHPSRCSISPSYALSVFLHSLSSPNIQNYFPLPAGRSFLLPPRPFFLLLVLCFIPHILLSLKHAASSLLLLLYSSQQWVSDLNLSLCITTPLFSSSGTPPKTNSAATTLALVPSFVCMAECVCNWTWSVKEDGSVC